MVWLLRMPRTLWVQARRGTLKDWLQALSFLTVAIAVYNFLNETIWIPNGRPPILVVSSTMERSGTKAAAPNHGPLAAISAKVTIKNPSRGRVIVLADKVEILGVQLDPPARTDDERYGSDLEAAIAEAEDNCGDMRMELVNRYEKPSHSAVIHAGILFGKGFYLDPDEEAATTFVFYVPDGAYDIVRLDYQVAQGRERNSKVDKVRPQYSVDHTTTTLGWDMMEETAGSYKSIEECGNLSQSYGMAGNRSSYELALWPSSASASASIGIGGFAHAR